MAIKATWPTSDGLGPSTHKQAVDAKGEALPWVTYSFIDFIKDRLNKQQRVFEYGSGSSTLFYAKRVAKVVSVEHDENWFNKIVSSKPENADMIFTKLETGGEYSKKAASLANNLTSSLLMAETG